MEKPKCRLCGARHLASEDHVWASGEKVTAASAEALPSTSSGSEGRSGSSAVSVTRRSTSEKFDREQYHREYMKKYMKEYMRKWREKKKKT